MNTVNVTEMIPDQASQVKITGNEERSIKEEPLMEPGKTFS